MRVVSLKNERDSLVVDSASLEIAVIYVMLRASRVMALILRCPHRWGLIKLMVFK